MILELFGIGLMLNAWFTLAGVFAIFIPTMLTRVRIEERALVEKFGDAYPAYMKTTPAIIPIGSGRKNT
jgi:protein-S-isoprenylcysteine O-methyltransferase Ste14